MSEVEWRGRTVPVKIDKVRIFLLGLADNEAAIAQVRGKLLLSLLHMSEGCSCLRCSMVFIYHKTKLYLNTIGYLVTVSRCTLLDEILLKAEFVEEFLCVKGKDVASDSHEHETARRKRLADSEGSLRPSRWCGSSAVTSLVSL